MRRVSRAALFASVLALPIGAVGGVLGAQIPGRGRFPTTPQQPTRPDTTKKDTTLAHAFPVPDSVSQRLMQLPGYSVTRYAGDTAFFNAEKKSLDLLAAGKKRVAAVERDSNRIVSDSGIYYTQARGDVITGGNYVLSPKGQSEIHGNTYARYTLTGHSVVLTHGSLPVTQGETWYLTFDRARIDIDTSSAKQSVSYLRGGTMTSCDDSVPDYQFVFKDAKRTGSNTLVAAPAVLKIKDIPIMWFPFIFSDTRPGRHSGILTPQFGIGDIVRSSPTYRRNVEHVGYYWAVSDYLDASAWLDWRSGAGTTNNDVDPGWLRYNFDFDYKWLDRFLGGRVGTNYTMQRNGQTNLGISWSHQEDLGRNQHINTNFNYVSSTTLQRQNTFNPYTALATIASQANYQAKLGPASLTVGATRKQYPGRDQIDQGIPTISLSTSPIAIGSHFSWTPGFSFSRNDVLHMDQPGLGAFTYDTTRVQTADGSFISRLDSVKFTHRNSSNATMSFDTPVQIFGWDFRQSFRVNQQRNNFPQEFTLYDVTTGAITGKRVYAATYRSDFDWVPEFQLPAFWHNPLNLAPSFSLQNIDPGPLMVASERTGGRYVMQGNSLWGSKRTSFGLSMSPTLYGFFDLRGHGIGPFSVIRHALTPTVSFSAAPGARVSDDYLIATGRTRAGYLGNLPQRQVTLGLTQNFEAKLRTPTTDSTSTDKGDKVKLLSLNFSPITYDFVRRQHAMSIGNRSVLAGFTTDNWSYSATSDLLPGFDFSSTYSLFEGSTLSDTARFKPYLTGVSASLNLSRDQNPFAVLMTRLFGKAVPEARKGPTPGTDQVRPTTDQSMTQALAAQPVAGSARGGDRFIVPPAQGWRASISFTRSSPRPPRGDSTSIIDFDPRARCASKVGNDPFLLDACLAALRAEPTTDVPVTSETAGGTLYRIPPTTSVNANTSFSLTQHWTAQWTTTYDVERHEFASHIVSLQRDLHDWRAIFAFTQSPNGNFAFNFTIALKAEPDIKFDYNRATVRSLAP